LNYSATIGDNVFISAKISVIQRTFLKNSSVNRMHNYCVE